MNELTPEMPVDFDAAMRRSQSRSGRIFGVTAKLTQSERSEVLAAATSSGKAAGEWSREVLLRAARTSGSDPLFTEIVGLRMLLVYLFEQQITPDEIHRITSTVRQDKHKIAREVMQQYHGKETA